MKVCILSAVNIRHMTLVSLYTERLRRNKIAFDIIYMDKYGEVEEFDADNKYVFTNIISHDANRVKKVYKYFRFKEFAIPLIEKNGYDFVVVWHDVTIFMFGPYLARKWNKKYCLNIRDYYGEKNPYVYLRFKQSIDKSAFTTISSDGFRSFLPKHNYVHVHSLNLALLSQLSPKNSFRESNQPIRIAFIGNVRFIDLNKRLLDIFKNDERFELNYYGTNAEILEKYAQMNGIYNCDFQGTFPVKETARYINKADIINNLYGSGSNDLDYALSIKLYHGIYSRIPILANQGTYSGDFVKNNGIGLNVNEINVDLPDKIYCWYKQLDFNAFNTNCRKLLDLIATDNEGFEVCFNTFISKNCSTLS